MVKMPRKRETAPTEDGVSDHTKAASPSNGYRRSDFLRDLKKVVRKLPPDHPSRSDSRKH